MPRATHRLATSARLGALALLWGSSFLLIKLALRGFTPYQIVLVQLALGAAVLIASSYVISERLPRGRQVWIHLAVAALLANVAPYLLFAVAERRIDSAVAGMINAITPLFTVVIAVLVGHERKPTRLQMVGLVAGITGVAILLAPWRSGTQFTSWGALAAIAASLCYAVSYVYIDRFLAGRAHSPVPLAGAQLLAASGLTVIALPFVRGWAVSAWRLDAVLALLGLGILATGVAYVLNYRIITDDGASAASLVSYLLPIVAVILGATVLHERPTAHAIIGVIITLAGVVMARHGVGPGTSTGPVLHRPADKRSGRRPV